jgi:beta-glucosidase
VVLVVGGTSFIYSDVKGEGNIPGDQPTCGEGHDRSDLTPPGVQPQLIRAICNTGKPVILVLINGRAYDLRWEKEHIPAILEAWYPGEQGGNAIARILTGEVNPSGRLPVTFPQSVGHVPVFYNHKPTGRGAEGRGGSPEKPGTSYVFSTTGPLFPFGFGLSYTQFEYSGLKISRKELSGTDTVKCSVNVRNTGKLTGKEVIQVYINDKVSSVTTPVKVLKEFKKVVTLPGETVRVEFAIPCHELGLWNTDMKYVVEPGEFEIMVGASAEDIRLRDSVIIK